MRISREGHLVTVINVFVTKPEQQQELIDQWIRFVEEVAGEPGMIGTALHRSTDGTRVVNYAQWRSKEDFDSGCLRSTTSKWRPVAHSPSASTPICTKSSTSLSAEKQLIACARESVCPPLFPRVSSRWRAGRAKGARMVWQSLIASIHSHASTTS